MERMQLQGPIITSLCWADQAAASASAAQVPFLALLQGATMGDGGPGVKRESYGVAAGFACRPAASDVDLLESCVTQLPAPPVVEAPATKRRKRPRTRPRAPPPEKRKKPEEAECQRMTHIAVERNRRRLMNDHLASLRALIPSDYIPRGDQATVVGGAIDYVKQLEQQLVALQALAAAQRGEGPVGTAATAASDGVFVSPQYTSFSQAGGIGGGVDVEAMAAVGGHVRLRVAGRRWPGRLVRAVAAMENLRMAVLHLAVTSVGHDAVVYCFNLKMEDGCEVSTADEVATVVHQIFAYAAGSCC
ncbi:transcription factor bHLH57-like [Triticum urartu]|uniref:BHLH domain-containing protein n=1 Tax=Triticum urartu TaxID=4572 RepID=A0A8R7ULI1_TRIUA|nr:transcription factor bHLH57-like [Triticum urartu]XP_048532750.1 transcription factor bHLH57-like [Triticum urartu]